MQDYINLFEIPIYGLSEQTLKKRVDTEIAKLKKECQMNNVSKDHQLALKEQRTYPMRNWEYNHIVGFIKVSTDAHDVLFNIYLPYDEQGHMPKYSWWASRKHFVREIYAGGRHFYLGNMKTNDEIRQRTSEMLHGIINELIPKRYCVDTRTFDAINPHLDFLSLMQK